MSGDQRAGFTYAAPMTMNAMTTPTLMNTTMLLTSRRFRNADDEQGR
jgi:hypothetical protein